MAFPEAVDLRIAMETASLQLDSENKEILQEHFNAFMEEIGDADPHSPESLKLYYEMLEGIPGGVEAYNLEDALIAFNLERLRTNLKT